MTQTKAQAVVSTLRNMHRERVYTDKEVNSLIRSLHELYGRTPMVLVDHPDLAYEVYSCWPHHTCDKWRSVLDAWHRGRHPRELTGSATEEMKQFLKNGLKPPFWIDNRK